MATVTLKDLMDPLAKIAKSTEDTSTKLDAVVAAFTGSNNGGSQAIITELQTQSDILRAIVGGSGSQAMISELQTQSNILRAIELNTRGGSGIQNGR